MRITLPVQYSQFDPNWAKILLGTNTEPRFDIYNYGCLITVLAMICMYYGKTETPYTINERLKEVGGFVNGGNYVHGSISKAYSDIVEKPVNTPKALTDDQMNEIKTALDNGQPVMVQIDYNPKTVEPDSHYVLLIDYNPNDENDFTIVDPLGGEVKSLKQGYLAWFKPSARSTIEQYFIYSGPTPAKVTEPVKPTEPSEAVPINTPAVPSMPEATIPVPVYQNEANVKMATQWGDLVGYLEIPKPPVDAMFDDAKRVIAGIKSSRTDFQNRMTESIKEVERQKITTESQAKELDTLKGDLLREQSAHKAEVDALKQSATNPDNLKKVYDSNATALKNERDEALQTVKTLKIEMAENSVDKALENGVEPSTAVELKITGKKGGNLINRLINFLRNLEA